MTVESATFTRRRATHGPGEDEVYERIHGAILEHRLRPGTKMAEEELASIFGISRARTRSVLARLAHEQIVEFRLNKGAYIARPSAEKAREVFESRLIIEPAIICRLMENIDNDKVEALRNHVDREVHAGERDDRSAIIRLSGEFHNLIGKLAGNSELERILQGLSAITCLILLLNNVPTDTCCRPNDHSAIVEAVAIGNGAMAERLIIEHLKYIEDSVNLDESGDETDLESIFR